VEESNDGTLELGATAGVDGRGGEGLPDDRLANVGSDEQRNTAAETVALLEKLVEQNNNKTSNNELDNQENTDTSTEVTGLAVETSQDVDAGLAEGKNDGEELLGGLVELAVGLQVEVDVDEVGTGEELGHMVNFLVTQISIDSWFIAYLEDHAGGDDRGDTQLHESTTVTGQHHTEPVQGVRSVG
jgi:hypothetical protein